MISLNNGGSTQSEALIGISDQLNSTSTFNCYYNSVNIFGSNASGSKKSYCFYRLAGGTGSVTGSTITIKDNILVNTRTGGSGSHYAIANEGSSSANNWAANASDYNFLAAANTATLGLWGSTNQTYSAWQTSASGDAHSQNALTTASTSDATHVNPTELFIAISTGNLHINTTPPAAPYPFIFVNNQGTTIAGTTTDIDGDNRPLDSQEDIGADEFSAANNSQVAFTVKFLIQGYYLNSGKMSPLLKLLNGNAASTAADTVTIELRASGTPNVAAYSFTGIVDRSDSISCAFNSSASGNAYYIVIRHRNSLETWSAGTVNISASGSYDFTTAASQAYGNNMVSLGDGRYAIYSGDVNQDGSINSTDYYSIEAALSSFIIGSYNVNDVNGDGRVDEGDYRIVKNYATMSVTKQRP